MPELSTLTWDALLLEQERKGLLRTVRRIDCRDGEWVWIGGRKLVNFSSNDYLSLARHKDVVQAISEAADMYGAGAGASPLVCGNLEIHEQLEAALAEFKKTESAVVFSTGYQANLAVVQALALRMDGTETPFFCDKLSHASIIDAMMSRRKWQRFAHNDVSHLESMLEKLATTEFPRAVVITEGVFSMDGDTPPLPEMLQLCEKHGAVLLLDDAHGTGTVGPSGRGTAAALGVSGNSFLLQIGTLSKALGSQGGYFAGPKQVRNLLLNFGRALIYDTALAPACAGAALAALRLLVNEPVHVKRLQANALRLRQSLGAPAPGPICTPIVPVVIGGADETEATAAKLYGEGYLAAAIRPPTVPEGTSRLRFTAMACHSEEHIDAVGGLLR